MPALVLDTNIVLDLFVFGDPRSESLKAALAQGGFEWLATPAMRDELVHVLAYAHMAAAMQARGVTAAQVVAHFDRAARISQPPPKASVACKDADDQKFIDLAVAHGARLLSKDKQVLALRRKLAAMDVEVLSTFAPATAL